MSRFKRVMCMLLSLVMVLGMFPVSAFATDAGLEMVAAEPVITEVVPEVPVMPEVIPAPVPEIIPEPVPEVVPVPDVVPEAPVLPAEPVVPEVVPTEAPVIPEVVPTVAPIVQPVAVYFNCYPAELSLYVYDAYGVPVMPSGIDGAYILMPGSYAYSAYAEGYVGMDYVSFTVVDGSGVMFVDVVLSAVVSEPVEPELPELPVETPVESDNEITEEGTEPDTTVEGGKYELPEDGVETEESVENNENGEAEDTTEDAGLPESEDVAENSAEVEEYVHSCEAELVEVVSEDETVTWHCNECGSIFDENGQLIGKLDTVDADFVDGILTSGNCGENLTWELSDGVLTIRGFGEMDDYASIAPPWSDSSTSIKSIIIETGVSKISQEAFADCSTLESVSIPGSVTSIGDYAFYRCANLKTIIFSEGLEEIGIAAFYECSSLTEITFPSTITRINDGAFVRCLNLTNVGFAEGRTLLLSVGKEVFYECTALVSVLFSDGLGRIGEYTFGKCTSLATVRLPFSVSSLYESTFSKCTNLTLEVSEDSYSYRYAVAMSIPHISYREQDADNILLTEGCLLALNANSTGKIAQAEISLSYSISETAWNIITNPKLVIEFSNELEIDEGSLRHNDSLCTDFVNEEQGTLEIPLVEPKGTLSFMARIAANTDLSCCAFINYSLGEVSKRTVLAQESTLASFLTVDAPTSTTASTISVSGLAPALAEVYLYLNGILSTTATADATGTYSAEIYLGEITQNTGFTISANSVRSDAMMLTASTSVFFRYNGPELGEIRFYNDSEGDSYIVLSGTSGPVDVDYAYSDNPYKFEIEFANPESIGYVYVTSTVGNVKKSIDAVYDEARGVFVAKGYFDENNKLYNPGNINVEYTLKTTSPQVGNTVDWNEINGYLGNELSNATVSNTSTGNSHVGTVNFSDTVEAMNGVIMNYAIKNIDTAMGSSLNDLRSYYKTGENILSYVVPGLDDSRYYAYLDFSDPNTYKMLLDDGLDVGGKAIELELLFTDSYSNKYMELTQVADTLSKTSQVVSILGETYNIYQDTEKLKAEIEKSTSIMDKSAAYKAADELAWDKTAFALMTTALPLLAAGGIASAPVMLFGAIIGVMSAASESVYQYRASGILGESVSTNWYPNMVTGKQQIGDDLYAFYVVETNWRPHPVVGMGDVIWIDNVEVTIQGFGPMWDYVSFHLGSCDLPWSKVYRNSGATKLNILPGITTIGEEGFVHRGWEDPEYHVSFSRVKDITLPSTLNEIGGWAFAGLGIETITFNGKLDFISGAAFMDCDSLKSVNMSAAGTIGGFNDCDSLETIHISTDKINNSAFCNCDSLKSINISSATTIGDGAFSECDGLEYVTIPNSVMQIGSDVFANCTNLKSVQIGSGIKEVDSPLFEGCSSLKTVRFAEGTKYIPYNIITDSRVTNDTIEKVILPSTVVAIDNSAFSDCFSLNEINLPNGLERIGPFAFDGCKSLKTIDLPATLKSIGERAFAGTGIREITLPEHAVLDEYNSYWGIAFSGMEFLTNIFVDEENTFYSSKDGILFDKNQKLLVYFPDGRAGEYCVPYGVTTIEAFAFDSVPLSNLTIPSTVNAIKASAFTDCCTLSEITFEGDAPSIDYNAFKNVTATANYYYYSNGWSSVAGRNYGGNLTWANYIREGDDPIDTGSCGDNVKWKVVENVLTIYGSGKMYDYSSADSMPWDNYSYEYIVIEPGVESFSSKYSISLGYYDPSWTNYPTPLTLTVKSGCHLVMNSDIYLYSSSKLIVEDNASIDLVAKTKVQNGTTYVSGGSIDLSGGTVDLHSNAKIFTSATGAAQGRLSIDAASYDDPYAVLDAFSGANLRLSVYAYTAEELYTALNVAKAYSGQVSVYPFAELDINRDIIVPENCLLLVQSNASLTVPEGYTLTVNGHLMTFGTGKVTVHELITGPRGSVDKNANVTITGCKHSWGTGKVTQAATCTEEGIKTFTCSKCGGTKTEAIPTIAHKLTAQKAEYTVCGGGYEKDHFVCSVCGGHYADSKGTTEAQYTEGTGVHELEYHEADYEICFGGYKEAYYECIYCGQTFADENASEPAEFIEGTGGHKKIKVNVPAVAATDEKAGLKAYTINQCETCGAKFKSDGSVYTDKEFEEYLETLTVYAKAKSVTLSNELGEIASGSTMAIELTETAQMQLSAEVAPVAAKKDAKWKTSSAAIATVDAEGLVTFLKPGAVTITATAADGSGKSANVKFDVTYAGYASNVKFTAKIADTSASFAQPTNIGLQMDDSVQLNLFGLDKVNPIDDLSVFDFSVTKGDNIVEIDSNGVITAIGVGSATVKAELAGDPLKRNVTVTVKTIAQQLGTVNILPYNMADASFVGVDANGELCSESNQPIDSYALMVAMEPKGGATRTFQIKPAAIGSSGYEQDAADLIGKFTWASTAAGVATVKEEKDGSVYITVKPGVDGACTITATSKDARKAVGSMAVYVMDYSPRLEAATVTLDSQLAGETRLSISSSYGNHIQSVSFFEYDAKAKTYFDSTNIDAVYTYREDAELGGFEEFVSFYANSYLKNQTIKGQLMVQTQMRAEPYYLPLNITVKNTAPAVTTKQLTKFNLFYTDSVADMTVTVKNELVTNVELVSDNFIGYWDGEKLSIGFNAPVEKPNTKATLYISLAGYEYPVEKAVTISTETKKPSLALDPASATANLSLGSDRLYIRIKDNTAKNYLDITDVNATLSPEIASELNKIDANTYEVVSNRSDFFTKGGGKVNVSLKGYNWVSPIVLAYTLKVNTTLPTLKPKLATLTLNSLYEGMSASTEAVLSQANIQGLHIEDAELIPAKADFADCLSVRFENGQFVAELLDSSIKAGSYAYSFVPKCIGYNADGSSYTVDLAAVKLTVKVVNTQPTAKLSASSVTLNNVFVQQTAAVEIIPTDASHAVYDFEVVSKATGTAALEAAKLKISENGGVISAEIKDKTIKAGSYSYEIRAKLGSETVNAAMKPLTLTVKVVNTQPKVTLSATSINLNTVAGVAGLEEGFITLKSGTTGYKVVDCVITPMDTKADVLAQSDLINIVGYGDQVIASLDNTNLPKAATYKFAVTPIVEDEATGETAELKAINFSVKVYANAKYSATVSAAGKLDAVVREDSAITYTLTKLTNVVGNVQNVSLSGQDAELFDIQLGTPNAKGQPTAVLKLLPGAGYNTTRTYKLQLDFTLDSGIVVSTAALSVKVSNTALKLNGTPKVVNVYQSQSRSRILYYYVDIIAPPGAAVESVTFGDVGLLQNSIINDDTNVSYVLSEDGRQVTVKVVLKDTSKLGINKTYKLPLLVKAVGQAENINDAKFDMSLKVLK